MRHPTVLGTAAEVVRFPLDGPFTVRTTPRGDAMVALSRFVATLRALDGVARAFVLDELRAELAEDGDGR